MKLIVKCFILAGVLYSYKKGNVTSITYCRRGNAAVMCRSQLPASISNLQKFDLNVETYRVSAVNSKVLYSSCGSVFC